MTALLCLLACPLGIALAFLWLAGKPTLQHRWHWPRHRWSGDACQRCGRYGH